MLHYVANTVAQKDTFHHPVHIIFNQKKKQGTVPGGTLSIALGFFVIFLWYSKLMVMTKFEKNHLTNFERRADMAEIGTLSLQEMGTLPFFSVHFYGHQLKIHDKKHCKEM